MIEENSTSNSTFDFDLYEFLEEPHHRLPLIQACLTPAIIVVGLLCNSLALVILFRHRLWLQHEGYIFMCAVFFTNVVVLTGVVLPFWLSLLGYEHVVATSLAGCRMWFFILQESFFVPRWILVAILLDVYLRDSLLMRRRYCGCPRLAIKYCSLRGVQVVAASILLASFVLNIWLACHPDFIILDDESRYCRYNNDWYFRNWPLLVTWRSLTQELPLFIIVPVLWVIIIYTRRKNFGFSFGRLNSEAGREDINKEFAVVALVVTLAVFILTLPDALRELMFQIGVELEPYYVSELLWRLTNILSDFSAFLTPVLCLALVSTMRQFVKEKICKKCCPFWNMSRLSLPFRNSDGGIPLEQDFEDSPVHAS